MGGNVIIYPNAIVTEGGNVQLGDGTRAEKMDLTKISREEVRTTLVELFEQLNLQYKEQFGYPLWSDIGIIKDGSAFTGSTESFFNGEISDEEYVQHKQRVGDVDLTVPESEYKNMAEFLKGLEGEWITENVKYLGVSKNNAGDQYNTLFEVHLSGDQKVNVQVDFEFVDWEGDRPSEFSKFIHNSDWSDVSQGIKGAFHKILLFSIAENISQNKNVAIVTELGSVKKGKTVKDTIGLHSLSFKGIRQKYVPVNTDEMKAVVQDNKRNKNIEWGDDNGQLTADGKKIFMELPSKGSDYSKDMAGLFEIMFGEAPQGDDVKMIYSFGGLMKALDKYFSEDQIKNVFTTFLGRLFGKGAVETERTDWQTDKETKFVAVDHFNEAFPFTIDLLYNDEAQAMINGFYDNYKARIKTKGYESVDMGHCGDHEDMLTEHDDEGALEEIEALLTMALATPDEQRDDPFAYETLEDIAHWFNIYRKQLPIEEGVLTEQEKAYHVILRFKDEDGNAEWDIMSDQTNPFDSAESAREWIEAHPSTISGETLSVVSDAKLQQMLQLEEGAVVNEGALEEMESFFTKALTTSKIDPNSSSEFKSAFILLLDTYHGLSEEQQIEQIKHVLSVFDKRVEWAHEGVDAIKNAGATYEEMGESDLPFAPGDKVKIKDSVKADLLQDYKGISAPGVNPALIDEIFEVVHWDGSNIRVKMADQEKFKRIQSDNKYLGDSISLNHSRFEKVN